jgi:hypothetical protein
MQSVCVKRGENFKAPRFCILRVVQWGLEKILRIFRGRAEKVAFLRSIRAMLHLEFIYQQLLDAS